jgi:hypothetical protein
VTAVKELNEAQIAEDLKLLSDFIADCGFGCGIALATC